MSKFTFISVVAEADSGVFFTHLSFILQWISFRIGREVMGIIPFLTTVTLSGRYRTKIDGILFVRHFFLYFKFFYRSI